MRERRSILFAGAGAAGVLLGVVLLTAVFGGGENEDVHTHAASPSPSTTAPQKSVASERASLPLVSTPSEGRDPFAPIVVVPRVPSVQGSRSAPAVSSGVTGTTAPSSGSTQSAGAASASLELKSISSDATGVVQLTVDGQSYQVIEGETFSYGYRLERIVGNCVEVSAQAARAEMCLPPAPAS